MNEKGVAYSLPGSFVPLGNNADLSSLTISNGTLSPGFATNTLVYNVTVGSEVASISVTPTVAESGATVKVNGTSLASGNSSAPLNLNVGSNTLLVQVTAQNGSDLKTYSLNVVRPGPPKLTGTALTSYTGSVAVLGATVSESASGTVTTRGFVLATASLPTVGSATSFTASTGGLGSFSVTASGLSSGVRYFARPFAENQDGIGYGNEVSFTTDTPLALGPGGIGQVADREIHAGEIQRFQLTLDSAKALELLLSGAGSGLQVRLRNASGALLETSSSGGISRKVLSGSYTVEIENTSADPKTYTFDLDASTSIFVTPAVTLSPSSLISKKLKPVSSNAMIRNAGELPDKLRVSASPGNRDFIVSYSNGGNITAAVVAGLHETGTLESIAPESVVRVSVTPNRKTLDKKGKIVRKTFTIQMTVSSQVMTTSSATGSVRVSTK
jgi:Cadherin-like beta sandwich domain